MEYAVPLVPQITQMKWNHHYMVGSPAAAEREKKKELISNNCDYKMKLFPSVWNWFWRFTVQMNYSACILFLCFLNSPHCNIPLHAAPSLPKKILYTAEKVSSLLWFTTSSKAILYLIPTISDSCNITYIWINSPSTGPAKTNVHF